MLSSSPQFMLLAFFLLLGNLVDAQDGFTPPDARLADLNPERPEAYRDLAEEFSAVKNSTLARNESIRLYLICAANSTGPLRRSALRGLIYNSRSQTEKEKFQLLAYLLDSEFSVLLQKEETAETKSSTRLDPRLQDLFRSLRNGKFPRVQKLLDDDQVQQVLNSQAPKIKADEIQRCCDLQVTSDALLLKMINVENRLVQSSQANSKQSIEGLEAWRKAFKSQLPSRLPDIKLSTVTEFDPAKSIYRNGSWKFPSD